ncbi:hypothetical protein BKA63DRAFT_500489 [Paraphoma chrysanthemicola]|nr:hypothetical protein BKA63DRAFT_500489 [Paraphoma chrysanthemicola]
MPSVNAHAQSWRNDNGKKCRFCDRKFTKEEHLRRHERTHTGEKPFKCPKCYKRYGRSDVLVRHLQTHAGESRRDNRLPTPDHSSMDSTVTNEPTPRRGSQSLQCVDVQSDMRFLLPPNREHPFIQPSAINDAPLQPPQTSNSFTNATHQHQVIPSSVHEPGSQLRRTSAGLRTPPPVDPAMFDNFSYNHPSGQIREMSSASLPAGIIAPGDVSRNGDELQAPEPRSNGVEQFGGVTSPFLFHQASHNSDQAPPFTVDRQDGRTLHETDHALFADLNSFASDPFPMEAEFDTYAYFGPTILDGAVFDTPRFPIQVSAEANERRGTFLPVEQTHLIRRLWRGRRSGPSVQLIWSLWLKVARHGADNILSKPHTLLPTSHRSGSTASNNNTSKWGMDDACRNELIHFCKSLDETARQERTSEMQSRSLAVDVQSESGSEKSVPGFSANGFPTTEVFDASLDFFFQYSPVQFVHKATFDAKSTPLSILLPMCLIGLASIYPERSKTFVLRYQKKLIRYCRNDMTSKSLEYGESWELLITISSAFLVNYLALGYSQQIEDSQIYSLAVQLLHTVKSHGLFSAFLGDDVATQLQSLPSSDESSWKLWARIESVKRLLCYLVLLDAACSRVMGSSGVLDCSQVELFLPCEESLFDASTLTSFTKLTQRGAKLIPEKLRLKDFHLRAPLGLNTLSMQTVLSWLCLQAAAARHALPGGGRSIFESTSCTPAEAFESDPQTKDMILAVIAIPSRYPEIFRHKEPINLLAWNNLGLIFTVDLDLLEIGCGREGSESARKAMVAVGKWSRSASARRAILHAAQIFSILSSTRIRESNFARADRLLFVSALVLSMYLFVMERKEDDEETATFELVQDIDWPAVGAHGLQNLSDPGQLHEEQSGSSWDAVIHFIKHGGPVSFSREEQVGGAISARKILLDYVYLLDSVGKWRESRFSQGLRILSDLMIESRC